MRKHLTDKYTIVLDSDEINEAIGDFLKKKNIPVNLDDDFWSLPDNPNDFNDGINCNIDFNISISHAELEKLDVKFDN